MSQKNRAPEKWGMISVYTGDGKGKTTAALGSAIRALAAGKRVAIVYFDKGGESHYSEREFIRSVIPAQAGPRLAGTGIHFFVTGLDRIDPESGRFRFGVTPEDIVEAKRGLKIVSDIFSSDCPFSDSHQVWITPDLLILDEINSTTALGMLQESEVLALLEQKPANLELIMTGRGAPASFIELADLVTEMKLVKHYFYKGVSAREGIDY
ncbi:MAG: cob(I)yrinic acid a,c-diamide adenosyltransferase [bacterium]